MVTEKLIRTQFTLAVAKFPNLAELIPVGRGWLITGSIDVIDDEGGYWDTYDVKIKIPPNYPADLPELEEVGGKIPRLPEWHNTVNCCLTTKAIMFTEMGDEITLEKWLVNYAHKYLGNHVLKVRTGSYASEEFAHGTAGIIEGYKRIFKTEDDKEVQYLLKVISGMSAPSKNRTCFCGSGKKYKRCFDLNPQSHRMSIPIEVLRSDSFEVANYLRSQKRV